MLLVESVDAVGVSRIPKLLARAGCTVVLLSPAGLAVCRSRYVSHHIFTESGAPAVAMALHRRLAERSDAYDWVIIGDQPVLIAEAKSPDRDWLAGWFPVPPNRDVRKLLTSKPTLLAECRKWGIPMPRVEFCRNDADTPAIASAMEFPLFIKTD